MHRWTVEESQGDGGDSVGMSKCGSGNSVAVEHGWCALNE